MITTFENRCVLKNYVVVLRPIFDKMYKDKNRSKYTCELYITDWFYSNKVGIVFAMYQRMRSKETSSYVRLVQMLVTHQLLSIKSGKE